jgi:hypothetical protein
MRNRTPICSIGEMRLAFKDRTYFLKPSFRAMAEAGTPKELVEIYATVNGFEVQDVLNRASESFSGIPIYILKTVSKPTYGKHVLSAACIIMQACCDDDITHLIGGWKPTPRGVKYIPGAMPVKDILLIARTLIEHGLIGKSPLKVPQRSAPAKATTAEFDVGSYISSARAHFGMSRAEAEDLTMTELQQMIKVKYPEPKGYTREEYDSLYEERNRLRAIRLAKEKGAKVNG